MRYGWYGFKSPTQIVSGFAALEIMRAFVSPTARPSRLVKEGHD